MDNGLIKTNAPSKQVPEQLRHLQPRVASLLTRHSDLQAFMKVMNTDVQQTYGRDERKAIMCGAPTMTVMDLAYGENAAAIWLTSQLTDLGLYAGVNGTLTERQYMQLAWMIVSEFGFLKATELMLFFYRMKSGRYGHFYGSIDPMVIMETLRKRFMPERAAVIDKAESEQRRLEREQMPKGALKPDEIRRLKERIQSITDNLTNK